MKYKLIKGISVNSRFGSSSVKNPDQDLTLISSVAKDHKVSQKEKDVSDYFKLTRISYKKPRTSTKLSLPSTQSIIFNSHFE
jgi:hypothetical protein